MKKCLKCGAELDDRARFCRKCGNLTSTNSVASVTINKPCSSSQLCNQKHLGGTCQTITPAGLKFQQSSFPRECGPVARQDHFFADIPPQRSVQENINLFSAFKKYAVFSGRATRKEYWLYILFQNLAFIIICLIGFAIDAIRGHGVCVVLMTPIIAFLICFVPFLAVLARRLHDIGLSAWWMLLNCTFIGSPVVLIMTLLPSQPHDNQYGKY